MARAAERWFVITVVLMAHGLLLWAWRHAAAPAPRQASLRTAPPVTVLRLIPPTPPAAATQALDAAATPPARLNRSPPPKHEAAGPQAPQAITVGVEPAASAALPPALDLSVPRAAAAPTQRTIKDQVRGDPRANTPRASVESRIAALNGPDRWEAEPMDATRTRWRRNGQCIEVHVARNAQIDPYNQSFSPTPKAVKPSCD